MGFVLGGGWIMDYGRVMGYDVHFPANQLGGSKKVWTIREYGLPQVWVKAETTVSLPLLIFYSSWNPHPNQLHCRSMTSQTWVSPSIVLTFISSTATSTSRFSTAPPLINPLRKVFISRTTTSRLCSCLYVLLGHDILMILEFGWTVSITIIRRGGNGMTRCK